MVVRFDTGTLGSVKRTPQGGIRVPASLTRTGVLEYTNPDGSIRREYRPPDEVFNADSLATLADAPVTNLHHGLVDATNWRRVTVGSLSGAPRQDGKFVAGDLVIQDATTISMVESGDRREVSCGYRCKLDRTPGTTPEGERYDAIQRAIKYNHIALVPRGRAGSDVVLRLDSAENQIDPAGSKDDTTMKIELIEGVEYEIGTAAHRKAVSEREDAARKMRERMDSLSELEGRVKALESENKTLREDAAGADARIAEAARSRVTLIDQASRAGVTMREDMNDDEIRRAVIAKVLPDVDLEGKDSSFVGGVFTVALGQIKGASAAGVREDAVRSKRATSETREDAESSLPPDQLARQRMIQNMGKRPEKTTVDKG